MLCVFLHLCSSDQLLDVTSTCWKLSSLIIIIYIFFFQLANWIKRGDKIKQSDSCFSEDEGNFPSLLEGYSLPEKLSRGSSIVGSTPKLSQKSSHVTVTLSKAKKRMEDHLNKIGFGRSKNKHGSFEEPLSK